MIRNSLSIRRRTMLSQKIQRKLFQILPIRYMSTKTKGISDIANLRCRSNFVVISYAGSHNRSSIGNRITQVHTTWADKQRCTLMLAITADGRKLIPYMIFIRKTIPKECFPVGIVVRAQKNVGWLLNSWMIRLTFSGNVCKSSEHAGTLRQPSKLVLDYFRGHTTPGIKAILGGMKKELQPLDVVINRPLNGLFWQHTTAPFYVDIIQRHNEED